MIAHDFPLFLSKSTAGSRCSIFICSVGPNLDMDRMLLQVIFQSYCWFSVKFHSELRSINSTCCQNSNTVYNIHSVSADSLIAFSVAIPQTSIDSQSVSSLESERAAKQTSKHRTTSIIRKSSSHFPLHIINFPLNSV